MGLSYLCEEIGLRQAMLLMIRSINGGSRTSLKVKRRFKLQTSRHESGFRSGSLLLKELTWGGASKHSPMDSSSTLILGNHFNDFLDFSGLIEHGRFSKWSLFLVTWSLICTRKILGEIIQYLLFLHFIRSRNYHRVRSCHTITSLNLSNWFLWCAIEIIWWLSFMDCLRFFLQPWISSWMDRLSIHHLLT